MNQFLLVIQYKVKAGNAFLIGKCSVGNIKAGYLSLFLTRAKISYFCDMELIQLLPFTRINLKADNILFVVYFLRYCRKHLILS